MTSNLPKVMLIWKQLPFEIDISPRLPGDARGLAEDALGQTKTNVLNFDDVLKQ